MIDISASCLAVETLLKGHEQTRDFKLIERADLINADPAITPWVGIYQDDIDFEPRTLGQGAQNWLARINLQIWVQARAGNARQAEIELGDCVKRVLTALLSDLTFGGTIEMIKKFRVKRAYINDGDVNQEFQHAIIFIQGEVRAGA